jgi:hypothetical protein
MVESRTKGVVETLADLLLEAVGATTGIDAQDEGGAGDQQDHA